MGDAKVKMKKIVLYAVVLCIAVLIASSGTVSAATLTLGSLAYPTEVYKDQTFTVSITLEVTELPSGGVTVIIKLKDNTNAVTITDAEKSITVISNRTQIIQWSVRADNPGTYSNPFTVTATDNDPTMRGNDVKTSVSPISVRDKPVLEVLLSQNATEVLPEGYLRLEYTIRNIALERATEATNIISSITMPEGWELITSSTHNISSLPGGGAQVSGYFIVKAPREGGSVFALIVSSGQGDYITKTWVAERITPEVWIVAAAPLIGGVAPVAPVMNVPVDPVTSAVTSTTTLTVEKATLRIPEGTIIKDAEGNPLATSITMLHIPTTAERVGAITAYEFGPSGTTFEPPIDLVIAYDPADIPAGFSETDLVIRMWDGTAWIDLDTTVDTVAHTATTKVSHFTIFALFAALPITPPPTPTPTPPPVVTPTPTPPVVVPPKIPWALIIGIIIAVIAVAAVAYYFYTKKKA